MKARQSNSKSPRVRRACRLRTSPVSKSMGRVATGGSPISPAPDPIHPGGFVKALQEGAYIKHFQYGLGVVTESDSERTSIDFDLHGPKKFVTSIMVVDAAEGTPPKRRRAKKSKKAPVSAFAPIAASK